MNEWIDLTGTDLGKRIILGLSHIKSYKKIRGSFKYWICQCECGYVGVFEQRRILRNRNAGCKSCGIRIKHGMSRSRTYTIWQGIKSRCLNKNCVTYPKYGGRGIKLCARWLDFNKFLQDMGERPSSKHTIERINNSKGYHPNNCKWATYTEQLRNTRNNHHIDWNGKRFCISEWAEITGIKRGTLNSRIIRGWPLEKVFSK